MKKILFIAKVVSLSRGNETIDISHINEASNFFDIFLGVEFFFEMSPSFIQSECQFDKYVLDSAYKKTLPLSISAHKLIIKLGGIHRNIATLKPEYEELLGPWLAKVEAQYARTTRARGVPTKAGQPTSTNHPAPNPEQEADAVTTSAITPQLVSALQHQLQQDVFGQDAAITAVCDGLLKSLFAPAQPKPLASFFFIGSSATGKTLLAERLAARLGDDWKLLTIPMSSMVNYNQSTMLDGNEASYTNARPGVLTDFVRQHPKTVVVFDDIEKAHPAVISKLNSLFNQGAMRDQFGFYKNNDTSNTQIAPPEVDFRQTIVIFTSNALEDVYSSASFQKIAEQNPGKANATLLDALNELGSGIADGKVFNSGLLNLMGSDALVRFKPLELVHLIDIAKSAFHKLRRRFSTGLGCELQLEETDALLRLLILSLAPDIDARQVARQIADRFARQVTQACTSDKMPQQAHWQLTEKVKAAFADFVAMAGDEDVIHWMNRKGFVLNLQSQAVSEGGSLRVVFDQLSWEKVIQHADLNGLGSISVEVPNVRLADIAGHNLVKSRLQQTINLLKRPEQIRAHNVSMPKGLLMYGPPGTGKTMLAKAFANEADLPFISVSGTDLLDLNFVKALFTRARKYAPAILFIDEIDVLGSREEKGYKVIINQLLTEIDGFNSELSPPVFIIAATNRPQDLDPALVRAGRIDIHLNVPTLDRDARRFFVQRYLALPHDGSLNEEALLNLTSGMSGADLEQTRREVVLEMIRQGVSTINQHMLLEFINQRKYGHRATVKRTLDDLTATAYHEAGHAIVSRVLNPETSIEQISIASRGNMAGFVAFNRDPEHYKRITATEILEEIAVLLAGRCAEIVKFGKDGMCAGASSDLSKASAIALRAITQFGLDKELGLLSVNGLSNELQQAINGNIIERVQDWLKQAEVLCFNTLNAHWPVIEKLVELLLEQDVLDGAILDTLIPKPEEIH